MVENAAEVPAATIPRVCKPACPGEMVCLGITLCTDRPLRPCCVQDPPIISEAVDKWVFDTFSQLFPPCGSGTPHQKDMLCGCDPTNPEHYVRISVDVEPALKAKEKADGTAFMSKDLSPSKVGDILARFDLRAKQNAINPDTCKAHGFRHKSISKGSAIFGVKPIQANGSSGSGAAATGAGSAAVCSGAAVHSAAPGAAISAGGGANATGVPGNGGVLAKASPFFAWAPVKTLAPPVVAVDPAAPSEAPAAANTVRVLLDRDET